MNFRLSISRILLITLVLLSGAIKTEDVTPGSGKPKKYPLRNLYVKGGTDNCKFARYYGATATSREFPIEFIHKKCRNVFTRYTVNPGPQENYEPPKSCCTLQDWQSMKTFWHKDFGLIKSNAYKSEKKMAKLMLAMESILGSERQIRELIQTQKGNYVTECQSYINSYEEFFAANRGLYSSLATIYSKFKKYKKKCHRYTTRVQTDWACNLCSPELVKNVYKKHNSNKYKMNIDYGTCYGFLSECNDYMNTFADFTLILQYVKGIASCTANGYQLFSPPTVRVIGEEKLDQLKKCGRDLADPDNYF
jgi:hypothetical protein